MSNESEIIKRLLKTIDRLIIDLEAIAKELDSIISDSNDAYKISISEKAKKKNL